MDASSHTRECGRKEEFFMVLEPLLLSKRQASEVLGVCVRTVEGLIKLGQLRVRRVGARILIPRRELENFADLEVENCNSRAVGTVDVQEPDRL